MKRLEIDGQVVLLDDADYPRFVGTRLSIYERKRGYPYALSDRQLIHRLIMEATDGELVDHINGNPLDNRRNNLRKCTVAQNSRNCKTQSGTSKYKGVYWHALTGKWAANIRYNRKLLYLGLFESEYDAAKTYDAKAVELYGEFARPNFPAGARAAQHAARKIPAFRQAVQTRLRK